MARKKITIVGAGRVGTTTAQLCAYKQLGDIVLVNRTVGLAQGIALDLQESGPIEGFDCSIKGTGDYADTANSDVIVITAGLPRKEGMSRDDLLLLNADIIRNIASECAKYSPNAVLVVVTNPLDAMVYVAKEASGFPKERVIGMAGILDTSRFKTFIADELKVSVEDVNALVLGSHGDLMVPIPSHASVNGIPLKHLMPKQRLKDIIQRTRNGGAEIIQLEKESSAYYAPASSLVQIVESIILDKKRVLPCAAYLEGEYGIKGIFMGVPVKVGSSGIEDVYELKLTFAEKFQLRKSAESVKGLIKVLKNGKKAIPAV